MLVGGPDADRAPRLALPLFRQTTGADGGQLRMTARAIARMLIGVDRSASCAVCSDVIGVYEPVLVPDHGEWRETSLAREPELRDGEAVLVHVACSSLLIGPSAKEQAAPHS